MNTKLIQWVLRIGVFGEFLGHGILAIEGNPGWTKYFNAVGIMDPGTIKTMLLWVGILDVALAVLVLIKPLPYALLWMALWGLWTAMIRWPIGPDAAWDFFERWSNWAAPFALYLMTRRSRSQSS